MSEWGFFHGYRQSTVRVFFNHGDFCKVMTHDTFTASFMSELCLTMLISFKKMLLPKKVINLKFAPFFQPIRIIELKSLFCTIIPPFLEGKHCNLTVIFLNPLTSPIFIKVLKNQNWWFSDGRNKGFHISCRFFCSFSMVHWYIYYSTIVVITQIISTTWFVDT